MMKNSKSKRNGRAGRKHPQQSGRDTKQKKPNVPAKAAQVRAEAPKAQAPKQEAVKQEAVKQEAVKQEAVKQETVKQEAPKQEAVKQEAPKQEAVKQEAVKQEAPKQETAKQETVKQEAPKQEAVKQEAPKQEAHKAGRRAAHRAPSRRAAALGEKLEAFHAALGPRYAAAREWLRVRSRRWLCLLHDAAADRQKVEPLYFLGLSAVLGVVFTLGTLYSTSYAVTVDGKPVGVVHSQSTVEEAIQAVEKRGRALLGYDYHVGGEVDCRFTLSLKSELSQKKDIETFFYDQLSEVSDQLRKYEIRLDGRTIGVVKDKDELNDLLDKIKKQYVTANTVSASFQEDVQIRHVYDATSVMTIDQMEQTLKSNASGETTYQVSKGDTFNAIAYANDMSVSDLKALNPNVNINRLMIGDVLNVKELVPTLSVETLDHEVYTEAIPCPVETREDSSMYKGSSKIVKTGREGEARITADVTYLNGYEKERQVLKTETLRDPTPTIKAVGTKERPKTASSGHYSWPVRGKITSYFGGRHIFGRYSFHSGLDIACSYGTPIKAADGGKVTFAGPKSSYGNLVIITHDNGTQTYYAHNSSLLVSAGQKVYKGQPIAKAGSTGRSTGVHCHFEVRVRGSAVNPLNYLP